MRGFRERLRAWVDRLEAKLEARYGKPAPREARGTAEKAAEKVTERKYGGLRVLECWDAVQVGDTWHRVYELIPPPEVEVAYARFLLLQESLVLSGRSVWLAQEISPGRFHFNWAARMRLRRIEQTTRAEALAPGVLEDERETGAAAALRAIHEAMRRGEPLARWRLWMGVTAPTLAEVREAGRELQLVAESNGFQARLLWARQWPTLRRIWLGGGSEPPGLLAQPGRLAPLLVSAGLVPVVGGGISDPQGVYVGHRLADGRRVTVDFFTGTGDSNIVVLGQTGSGKSTFMKALIVGLRQHGTRIVVMDLDGEGRAQCSALDGVWLDLTAATGRYIDPLILPPPVAAPDWLPPREAEAVLAWNAGRLALAVETVKGFVSVLAGRYWTPDMLAVVHQATLRALSDRGIDPDDQETWGQRCTMADWWRALVRMAGGRGSDPSRTAARTLVNLLEPYFEGRLAMFREPVALADADAIWIHLATAMSQGTDSLVATAKMQLALSTLWAVTVQERVRGERFTALFFDEGQRLLQNATAAGAVRDLVTGVRKYNAMTVLATNMPSVFWKTDGGRAAWQNSSYRVLFGLQDEARRELADAAPSDDDQGLPRRVLARLADFGHKGTELEHAFLFRHPVRGWDELVLKLPAEELDLYKTRGLRRSAEDQEGGTGVELA